MAQMSLPQALALAISHHDAGRLAEAESLYRQILQVDPRNSEALRSLGLLAHQVGRPADAEQLIRQAAALQPRADYFSNLGVVLAVQKKYADAIGAFQQSLAMQPNDPQTLTNLGGVLIETQRFAEAIAIYQRVIAQQPGLVEAHYNLGKALQESGDLPAAVESYRRATSLQPKHADAWNNLGTTLKQLGRAGEAITAFQQALLARSDFAEAQNNLGAALSQSGNTPAAIDAYQKAIALRGAFPEAQNNLGNTLERVGRKDEAAAAYRAALAVKSDFPEAYNNLANVLLETGNPDAAIDCYRKAIDLRPDYADALNNLANALKETGRIAEAIIECREASKLSFDSRIAGNLSYLRHFDPLSTPQDLCDLNWDGRFTSHITPMIHANDRDPNRRLRIGYSSPDLREHPVGRFMLPLMRRHDHAQFEIHCYTDNTNTDPLAMELCSHADAWNITTGLSDSQLAEKINADGIDVLVDLTMHLKGSRLLAFAHKPAPVQITYLAYCSTTSMRAMDYRFTDTHLDPEDSRGFYSEKSVYLNSYWCYPAPTNAPDPGPLPADGNAYITFGCLNNFSKVNESVLVAWSNILNAVPDSRLVIHAHEGSHRQEALDLFARHHVGPDRITFNGFQPLDRYLGQYQQIDIALDPFPYAGGTTTCDALWMGVPVVSRSGATAVSRGGASLLTNLQLDDLVGKNDVTYLRIAIDLANDLERLRTLRTSLRAQMMASPLMDDSGFTRDVEFQYRDLWKRWIASV